MGNVEIYFGWDSSESIVHRTITASIQIINKKRQTGESYHLNIKRLLANQMLLEEYLANTENKEIQFNKVWNRVYIDVSNT